MPEKRRKKKIKGIVLAIVLLFPVLVFVFLKRFGENQFDVPVYHQEGVIEPVAGCSPVLTPYSVPPLPGGHAWEKGPTVVYFQERSWTPGEIEYEQIVRICEKAGRSSFGFVRLSSSELAKNGCIVDLIIPENEARQWKQCHLLMPPEAWAVLVDEKGLIRGYYDIGEREETGRLLIEIDIILKNRKNDQ